MAGVRPKLSGWPWVRAVAVLLAGVAAGVSHAQDAPDKPIVNMPDGVQAAPLTSTMVLHPDPQCPGMANFRSDSISYTEWANNKVVSTWTNTTETFLGCVETDPGAPDPAPPAP